VRVIVGAAVPVGVTVILGAGLVIGVADGAAGVKVDGLTLFG
jgi:hypothetical protein